MRIVKFFIAFDYLLIYQVCYSQVIIQKDKDLYKKSVLSLGYEVKDNLYKNVIQYPDSYKDPEQYDFSYECSDMFGS